MGGSSGGGYSAPTQQELQQQTLQNQLLQMQIADEMSKKQQQTYEQSAPYVNAQAAEKSAAGLRDYTTAKTNALMAGQNNIKNAFNDLGEPGGATPYLAALQADADKLSYHAGADAVTTPSGSFDEATYLAANPDVAAAVAQGKFASGKAHYDAIGNTENRQGTTGSATSPHGTDWWDDPSTLATKDYIGNAISDIRTGRKDTARDTAASLGQQRLAGMGLDADTTSLLSNLFNTQLGTAYTNAGTSANDYSGVFNADAILDSVTSQERNARRTGYTNQTRALFGGVDPNSDFDDTADDSYINDIVGRSYSDAFNSLERAKARGSLTDTGYNAGLSYLGDQNKTALSTAQTLGGAVLERDRGALSGIKNNALTTAGGWDFGQSFDPNKYLTDYATKKGSLTEGLGGEISSALAGQNWFNVGDVLTKAGYAQGAQNVKPLQSGFQTPALATLQDERKKNAASERGLGGTGVF
jgi:hypothetical protein